jgi:hypothetical protein
MSLTETQTSFEAYPFDRLDGDAMAGLWHGASGIADAKQGCGRLIWWPDEGLMRSNHRALCEVYRAAGYRGEHFEIESHVPMGAAHAFALLRWTLRHTDGSVVQQFRSGCQLMRTADGLRMLLASAHQEDPRAMRGDASH